MKKLILAVFVGTLARGAYAGDTLESLRTWFKHLRDGLTESSVSSAYQRHRGVTAVAAVRGAPQDAADANKPAWKITAKSKSAAEKKEQSELAAAMDEILSGNFQKGRDALDRFETAHPKSKHLTEVANARRRLKEMESLTASSNTPAPGAERAAPAAPAAAEQR